MRAKILFLNLFMILSLKSAMAADVCKRCEEMDQLAAKFQALNPISTEDQKKSAKLMDESNKYFDPLENKTTKLSSAEFKSLIFLAVEANLYDPETEIAEVVGNFVNQSRDTQMAWARLKDTLSADCKWQAFASSVLEHRCNSRGDIPKEQAKFDKNPECKNRKFVDYRACLKAAKTK